LNVCFKSYATVMCDEGKGGSVCTQKRGTPYIISYIELECAAAQKAKAVVFE